MKRTSTTGLSQLKAGHRNTGKTKTQQESKVTQVLDPGEGGREGGARKAVRCHGGAPHKHTFAFQ